LRQENRGFSSTTKMRRTAEPPMAPPGYGFWAATACASALPSDKQAARSVTLHQLFDAIAAKLRMAG
jgi:hypothetical protein